MTAVFEQNEVGGAAEPTRPRQRSSLRVAWSAVWTSRLVIFLGAMISILQAGVGVNTPTPTGPMAYLRNLVTIPYNRWDASFYITIAQHGYTGGPSPIAPHTRMAFFPLYPGIVHIVGLVMGVTFAGILVSFVAFLIALVLLHRLVLLDFSHEVAEVTVMLTAFLPMAFFFSAVYTESLFLMLTIGCVYAARRERWWIAGVLGLLASATRNEGVFLLFPVALLLLYGPRANPAAPLTRWASQRSGWRLVLPRYRLQRQAACLALIPIGVIAYVAYLQLRYHAGLQPLKVQQSYWDRHTTWPFLALWHAGQEFWNTTYALIIGNEPNNQVIGPLFGPAQGSFQNLYAFVGVIIGLIALVLSVRRVPFAYWAYTAVIFLIALSDPNGFGLPLEGFPRYELVYFPLFIWAANGAVRRGWALPLIGSSALGLGVLSSLFATNRFIF